MLAYGAHAACRENVNEVEYIFVVLNGYEHDLRLTPADIRKIENAFGVFEYSLL